MQKITSFRSAAKMSYDLCVCACLANFRVRRSISTVPTCVSELKGCLHAGEGGEKGERSKWGERKIQKETAMFLQWVQF